MYGPDDLAPAAGIYSGDDMGVSIWRGTDARDERHDSFRQDGGGHNVTIIYVLLVAHFVGDFICQSDWMAIHKSKRWDALAAHVAAYSAVLFVFLALLSRDEFYWFWYFITFNAAVHFGQDAITSRINMRLWQANQRHWFFVGIGADQLVHYVTLFITAGWWLQ